MYPLSVYQWSPFCGCKFNCIYCKNSFQAQLKRWAKKNCQKCYDFIPHEHPERLDIHLPSTGYMQFIFVCPMGDISFCSTEYLKQIVKRMEYWDSRTFLIQSKNPKTFERVEWPDNVILGTTIEADEYYYPSKISKAPCPSKRFDDFENIKHPYKMITIEPVMDFGIDVMIHHTKAMNPCMVWLGYDTKKNNLPEPPIEKVKQLHWELSKLGIPVILKHIPEK